MTNILQEDERAHRHAGKKAMWRWWQRLSSAAMRQEMTRIAESHQKQEVNMEWIPPWSLQKRNKSTTTLILDF